MSYICFRLEDKNNEGPFFHKNGVAKFNSTIISTDKELSAFSDISRFAELSYIDFYLSPEYTLYKIEISKITYEENRHILFLEEDIINKLPIQKPKLDINQKSAQIN